MSQKNHLLNLTTKQKQNSVNTSRKQQKKQLLIIYSSPAAWWDQRDHDVDIYLNNICKNNKQLQLKYTYKFKL